MSWMMNNLICSDCGYEEFEAMYKRKNGPDDCPECKKPMSVNLKGLRFAIHGQGHGSFASVDFGVLGKAETKEDYDRCVKTIENRFPGKRVEISHETTSQKSDRIDTIRHNKWERDRARGLDTQLIKQIDAHKKSQKRAGIKVKKSHTQLARGE